MDATEWLLVDALNGGSFVPTKNDFEKPFNACFKTLLKRMYFSC